MFPLAPRFRLLCSDDDFSVAEAVITAACIGKKFPLPRIDLEFEISLMKNFKTIKLVVLLGTIFWCQF